MTNINEVIETYKKEMEKATTVEERKAVLDKANEGLKGTGLYLDPDRNTIKPEEAAIVCEDVSKINGFALLDTGTGTMDKVEIKNGKLVYSVGEIVAFVVIGDALFEVQNGTDLVRKK